MSYFRKIFPAVKIVGRCPVGYFKEQLIERNDLLLQDLEGARTSFHAQWEEVDSYSLFLPNYENEVGAFLPHERSLVPASEVLASLK